MFLKNNKLGIIWSLVIIGVCIIPGSNLPKTSFLDSFGLDKVLHAFFYVVLMFFVTKGLLKKAKYSISRNAAITFSFLYCFALGVGVEFLQSSIVTGRTGDIYDIIANNIGALAGVFVMSKSTKSRA